MLTDLHLSRSACLRGLTGAPDASSSSNDHGLGELTLLVKNLERDPITCGLAVADFLRSRKGVGYAQATRLICHELPEECGMAISALLSETPARKRMEVLGAALRAVPTASVGDFARVVISTALPADRDAIRDSLVISATEALEPEPLAELLVRAMARHETAASPSSEKIRELVAESNFSEGISDGRDDAPAVPDREGHANISDDRQYQGANWALLLTLAGSAFFFLSTGIAIFALAF